MKRAKKSEKNQRRTGRAFRVALAFICTIAMLVSNVPLGGVTPVVEVEASTGGHTQAEAVAWIKARADEKWMKDVDGVYGCQCVDLVKAYYQWLGVGAVSGNGCDYWTNKLPSGWKRDSTPSPGAIISWKANADAGWGGKTNEYGHVGLVYAVSGNTVYTVETNTSSSAQYAQYKTRTPKNVCYIHPDFPATNLPLSGADRIFPDGDYKIIAAASASASDYYYLDIPGASVYASNGANVELTHSSHFVETSDIWTLTYNSGFYTIRQRGTDFALDVAGASMANLGNVDVYTMNGTDAQEWQITYDNNAYRLEARHSGKSLDYYGNGELSDGLNVQQYEKSNIDTQRWCLIPYKPTQLFGNGKFIILMGHANGFELDVAGDEEIPDEDKNVQVWSDTCDSRYNAFNFVQLDNGYYKILHATSGKALTVDKADANNHNNVLIRSYTGGLDQQWAVIRNTSGGYSIVSACNGYALDNGGRANDGGNVALSAYYEWHENQSWIIRPAECKIIYDLDGGSGVPTEQTVYYDHPDVYATISSETPTKNGYKFVGWELEAYGIIYPELVSPGGEVYIDFSDFYDAVYLHAVWSADPVSITKQPDNTSATVGEIAEYIVSASGTGELSYQWQSRKDASASWTNSGQTGAKTTNLWVATTAGLDGWQFRCVVTAPNGEEIASAPASLTIVPEVTKQPSNTSVSAGSTAKFTVAASGKGPLSYQWQSRKNSSSSWAHSSQTGAKTATLSVATTAGLNGWQFRCVVTSANGLKAYSSFATLTISDGPKITSQPASTSVSAGTMAKFTVAASGTGTLTYQWQSRKDSSATWSNSGQSGSKTATLSVATTAGLNGWQFRCIVTDASGRSVASNAATVSVAQTAPKITTQPSNKSVTAGTTAKFTVAASGTGTITYQWQSRKNSSATWANSGQSGSKTATLSVATTAGLNGWQFRCIVTDGNGQTVTSSAATLTVTQAVLKIASQPVSAYVSAGSTAKFSVTATGSGTLSYQWQSRKHLGAEWSNMGNSGAQTGTLSVGATADTQGYYYRCVIKDNAGKQVISNEVRLTMYGIPINSTYFPDENFRLYIKDGSGWYKSGIDTDHDGILSASEIESVKEIDCDNIKGNYSIKSLKGIEFFTNLEVLSCNYNYLSSIDLSRNQALKEFHFQDSANQRAIFLDVSGCIALEKLYVDYLSSPLDLSKNVNLETLSVWDDEPIDISNNTKLKYLSITRSETMPKLDLSHNTALEELTLELWDDWNNPSDLTIIPVIDVRNNKKLRTIIFWLEDPDTYGEALMEKVIMDDDQNIEIEIEESWG
jgi:hypothetical protein